MIANRVVGYCKNCVIGAGLLIAGIPSVASAGILYECRLEGMASSYLLGTMHASDPRVLSIADDVESFLEGVDRRVLEIVPDGQAVLATLLATQLPADTSLEKLLPEELYRAARSAMSARGVPEPALQRMRPWAVSVELSMPPAHHGVFLDMRIYQMAQEAGKTLIGLETVDEQLGLFDGLSLAQQIELLAHAIKNLNDVPQQFNAMIEAYVSGDLESVERLADEQQRDLDEALVLWFDREVVVKRNRVMAKRVWPLLEKGKTLVAVGALHLVGETGLLTQLRERGCNFQRLR